MSLWDMSMNIRVIYNISHVKNKEILLIEAYKASLKIRVVSESRFGSRWKMFT